MPREQTLAGASSSPVPPLYPLPERFVSDMTDEIACLREVFAAYQLLERMFDPGQDQPSPSSLGAMLRILNETFGRRVASVEALMIER